MGLAIDKKISLAIVYLPVYDQLYTAIRGQGTKLNKKPVKVSKLYNLKMLLESFLLPTGVYLQSLKQRSVHI